MACAQSLPIRGCPFPRRASLCRFANARGRLSTRHVSLSRRGQVGRQGCVRALWVSLFQHSLSHSYSTQLRIGKMQISLHARPYRHERRRESHLGAIGQLPDPVEQWRVLETSFRFYLRVSRYHCLRPRPCRRAASRQGAT